MSTLQLVSNAPTAIAGFPPIAAEHAMVLVLGTLPGRASIEKREYYAQRGNTFWRLMDDLIGGISNLPYPERTSNLAAAGIAVWDVCEAATRPGSLDSSIEVDSVQPNDIAGFMAQHARVKRICFNGSKAEKLFRHLVVPRQSLRAGLELLVLPSTSAANTSMPYAEKLRRWSQVLP
jgi:hypoxanthine-DNA glycosylase